ncbi:hypothetical protein [Paraburkholderia sp. HP33-1]|nr:hypothetical protein [Paraburkholderia sp. HP33-1]
MNLVIAVSWTVAVWRPADEGTGLELPNWDGSVAAAEAAKSEAASVL